MEQTKLFPRERTGLFFKEITYLLPAGTAELRKRLPCVLELTPEDGEGIDVVTYQEQGEFAVGWMIKASDSEWDIINQAIKSHFFHCKRPVSKLQVIRLDFFVQNEQKREARYNSYAHFDGGKVVHANVALRAADHDEEDNWHIFSTPVLVHISKV